ncbi:hypothetical protein EON65_13800 [archaeon]|nr:MAG: hypothetical protein EON65_13800 [archaeon]
MSHFKESVRLCLNFEERPSTPPELRKFRRSAYLDPGKRFQHPGVADDYPQMRLEEKIFGMADKPSRDGAADLISHPKKTDLQRMQLLKSEKIYKHTQREPLGHSPDRKMTLPLKFTHDQQPFGVKSSSSLEPAKNLIFPQDCFDSAEGTDLYKRSHGSYGPGEQKKRGYDWKVDPNQTRFGAKGDTIAFNGVSQNIRDVLTDTSGLEGNSVVNLKKVEDFRNMGNMLGQTRNLGQDSGIRPRDMVYGKPSGLKTVSAADVIKGKYGAADLQPDRDLGKSILPGFRNLTVQV